MNSATNEITLDLLDIAERFAEEFSLSYWEERSEARMVMDVKGLLKFYREMLEYSGSTNPNDIEV
jgi:hypothetical protein